MKYLLIIAGGGACSLFPKQEEPLEVIVNIFIHVIMVFILFSLFISEIVNFLRTVFMHFVPARNAFSCE